MKPIYHLLFLLAPLLMGGAQPTTSEPEEKVALLFTDYYYLLGESTAEKAQMALAEHEVSAQVTGYYHSDLEALDYETLAENQLIFIDIIDAAKVANLLPILNQLAESGIPVYAVGAEEASSIEAYQAIRVDPKTATFYEQSGVDNLVAMILDQGQRALGLDLPEQTPTTMPDFALCNLETKQLFETFEAYQAAYAPYMEGNPWVAINLWRSDFLSEQLIHLKEYAEQFEDNGFNVLFYYGYPPKEEANGLFYNAEGELVPEVLLVQAGWLGANPRVNRELYETLGIPVINMMHLNKSAEEWMESQKGIPVYSRTSSLNIPEQMGMVQPIITSTKEVIASTEQRTTKYSVLFQVQRLLKRVQQLHVLQNKPNAEKQIAVIYYSHPPGKELLGASYLNVVPNSLHTILERLQVEGYDLGEAPVNETDIFERVSTHGINIGQWAPREVDKLVATGNATLIPMELYQQWYARLASSLQAEIEEQWGKPEDSYIMVWTDEEGKKYFVLPSVQYGNVLLTPQPVRGWSQDIDIMHHDISIPPHHQYVAFYLYLQYGFDADAVVHLGTHGTLEWLPGKESGLNQHDASEALIGDLVNVYPYIMDDVGEGLQAKRRSGAIIIDHMTPPFDKLGVNPILDKLEQLISEHEIAESKSIALANAKFNDIYQYAVQSGILVDLGMDTIADDEELHYLEHYIEEVQEEHAPLGLHTYGRLPSPESVEKFAQAIASQKQDLSQRERAAYVEDIRQRINASAPAELAALVDARDGRYVPA
ncbi:MAG TPA: hypothetical protein DCE41_08210, partial [Cytophagales bacterium]|nr:hypothetical protein [Cytophagales bacterium]